MAAVVVVLMVLFMVVLYVVGDGVVCGGDADGYDSGGIVAGDVDVDECGDDVIVFDGGLIVLSLSYSIIIFF